MLERSLVGARRAIALRRVDSAGIPHTEFDRRQTTRSHRAQNHALESNERNNQPAAPSHAVLSHSEVLIYGQRPQVLRVKIVVTCGANTGPT